MERKPKPFKCQVSDDAIRAQARTIFHPAGRCRMGSSPSAAVDLECQVNGIDGLRVADCSVMLAQSG